MGGRTCKYWASSGPVFFLSFAVILSSLCNWKGAQSYKKLPETIVPKVGHGPKMGQDGFDRACFSVVFLFLLCFIAYLYEANGGTDMEVLACFRPCFFPSCTPNFLVLYLQKFDSHWFASHSGSSARQKTDYPLIHSSTYSYIII